MRDVQLLASGVLFAIIIPLLNRKNIPLALLIPLLFFTLHAAVFAFCTQAYDPNISPLIVGDLQRNAAQIYALLLCFSLCLGHLPPYLKRYILLGVYCVLMVDGVGYFYKQEGLLFSWSTFEAAMMALMLPWAFDEAIPAVLPLLAFIVLLHGLTGLAIAAACVVIYLLPFTRSKLGLACFSVCLTFFSAGIFYSAHEHLMLAMHERLVMWESYLTWFKLQPHAWVTGIGLGSFENLGPQFLTGLTDHRYILMHNDYAQLLFETGVPGLLMLLWALGYLVWRSRESPRHLATITGFAICGLTYFPLHFFVSQVMLLFAVDDVREIKNE